jgi:hypothetical protein
MDRDPSVEKGKVPRALPYLRLAEIMGLLTVIWGFAASQWWLALTGAFVIFISYAVFRRHPSARAGNDGSTDSHVGNVGSDGGGD